MLLQTRVATRNAGRQVCPVCGQMKGCIELGISKEHLDHTEDFNKGVVLCAECMTSPGVSFRLDIPYKDELAIKSRRKRNKRIKKEEEKTGKEIGGRKTLASGALNQDGDSKNENWMVEEKSTQFKSFSIKQDVISKAMRQATRQRKNFVIKVRMAKHVIGIMLWNDLLPLIREEE